MVSPLPYSIIVCTSNLVCANAAEIVDVKVLALYNGDRYGLKLVTVVVTHSICEGGKLQCSSKG